MPRGRGGHRFTAKQDRMARHIATQYGGGARGRRIGYATVNKYRASQKRKRVAVASKRRRR